MLGARPGFAPAHLTARLPVLLPPFAETETWTVVSWPTEAVVSVNVPLVWPVGTVKLAGIDDTAADPVSTVRLTAVSTATGWKNVTVPNELLPPTTVLGVNTSPLGALGLTVRVPVLLPPLALALI